MRIWICHFFVIALIQNYLQDNVKMDKADNLEVSVTSEGDECNSEAVKRKKVRLTFKTSNTPP